MNAASARSAPWHLWAVAILTLFWNGAGAVTILLALAAIVLTNAYDVGAGTSLTRADQGWRNLTIVLVIIALIQFAYAWMTRRRGILR